MRETSVCVGSVVRRADTILLVRQSPGHSLEGLWTVPWGRLEQGESPTAAALREVREEAGIVAEVEGLIGLHELPEPWLGMLGILYLCTSSLGEPCPDHRETDAARFFRADQLGSIDDAIEPLSAFLAQKVLSGDYRLLGPTESDPLPGGTGYF